MPPRGANQGFSITPIITHHLFLFTTFLAIAGWFTAFVSQCFLTSDLRKAAGPAIGSLWFAIFLELFFILGVLYTIATDSIAMHRLQISVFGAVAIIFSVEGTTTGIYAANGAANAMGAGYLILSIVNILWVGYFTSEDDSLALHIFNMLGTGGLTPPSRRRRTRQSSILHGGMQSGNGYPANYGSGGGIGSADGYDAKLGSGAYGSPNPAGLRNQNSFGGSLNDNTRSIGGAGGPASIHNQTSIGGQGSIAGADNGPSSPLMAGIGSGNSGTNLDQASPPTEQYLYKAKALYAYTANPDDPNEISFAKGEILDIVDKQGKWWQAKKADGTSGIAPSNYLHVI